MLISYPNVREETDDDGAFFAAETPAERNRRILAGVFPIICNDVGMLIQRPFRLIWDPTIDTASTDCVAEVRMSPWFFLKGYHKVGFGTGYHEGGHCRWSTPWGTELLAELQTYGEETGEPQSGAVLRSIGNILLDRRDDLLTTIHAPGFADTLRRRLAFICTMSLRQELAPKWKAYQERRRAVKPIHTKITAKDPRTKRFVKKTKTDDALIAFVKNYKPSDEYTDFFLAAKWHKRPHFRKVHKIMRTYLRRDQLLTADKDYLKWAAIEIWYALDTPDKQAGQKQRTQGERVKVEKQFVRLCLLALSVELGANSGKLDPETLQTLGQIVQAYLAGNRKGELKKLASKIRNLGMGNIFPRPISTGLTREVPIIQIPTRPQNRAAYDQFRAQIRDQEAKLLKKLRLLETPAEYTLFRQDEGDLDLGESGRIALGLPGVYRETVLERDIDVRFDFIIDESGSMSGTKLGDAKRIAVLFTEGVLVLGNTVEGHVWGYNSEGIYVYGPVSRESGFVNATGNVGNADTNMLRHVGTEVSKSRRRVRVMLILCDDGPDDIDLAKKLSHELAAQGILVIHAMIDVHGSPNIYPIELLYSSTEEFLDEFGDLVETILRGAR